MLDNDAAMRLIGVRAEGTEGVEMPRLIMSEMAVWQREDQPRSLAIASTAHVTRTPGYFLDTERAEKRDRVEVTRSDMSTLAEIVSAGLRANAGRLAGWPAASELGRKT